MSNVTAAYQASSKQFVCLHVLKAPLAFCSSDSWTFFQFLLLYFFSLQKKYYACVLLFLLPQMCTLAAIPKFLWPPWSLWIRWFVSLPSSMHPSACSTPVQMVSQQGPQHRHQIHQMSHWTSQWAEPRRRNSVKKKQVGNSSSSLWISVTHTWWWWLMELSSKLYPGFLNKHYLHTDGVLDLSNRNSFCSTTSSATTSNHKASG